MTEKRFELIEGVKKGTHSGIWDNQKQHNMGIGDELWIGEVVAMLNEGVDLAEENERLKFENETLKSNYQREIQSSIDFCNTYSKTNGELLDEIDQLKQSDNITDLETQIMKLKEENQFLKKELFEAKSECLWVTSDEVDRALHYEDEVEELRKEIFE